MTHNIILIILFIVLLIALLGAASCLYNIERNKRVYSFRIHVLYNYPISVYESMPDYGTMMRSFKPLKVENWVSRLETNESMNQSELRIGNIIRSNRPYFDESEKEVIVSMVSNAVIGIEYKYKDELRYTSNPIHVLEGIPLTEVWLEKFGFEMSNDDGYSCDWTFNGIIICQQVDFFIEDKNSVPLEFVHELQNLYFYLKREELKIAES